MGLQQQIPSSGRTNTRREKSFCSRKGPRLGGQQSLEKPAGLIRFEIDSKKDFTEKREKHEFPVAPLFFLPPFFARPLYLCIEYASQWCFGCLSSRRNSPRPLVRSLRPPAAPRTPGPAGRRRFFFSLVRSAVRRNPLSPALPTDDRRAISPPAMAPPANRLRPFHTNWKGKEILGQNRGHFLEDFEDSYSLF